MTDLREIRFVMSGSRSHPKLVRTLVLFAMGLSLVPGIVIIVAGLVAGPDASVAFIGLLFVAGAVGIWASVRRLAEEVSVVGADLSWRGHLSSGSAPLADLKAVRPARWPRAGIAFDFGQSKGFWIVPARGVEPFVEGIRHLRPDVLVRMPRGMRWISHFYRKADVVVSIDGDRPGPPAAPREVGGD